MLISISESTVHWVLMYTSYTIQYDLHYLNTLVQAESKSVPISEAQSFVCKF